MKRLRLILDAAGDGASNMAFDQALLACGADAAGPTLRLYGWRAPTVTLGRFQDASDVDAGCCARRGIDVVRRPTGGRAVLHHDEVTYSIVAGPEDGVPRGVVASYRYLADALVWAYGALGVTAEVAARPSQRLARSPACYLQATRADLAVGTAKLSGSAQVWRGGCVLQHGSFVVSRDVSLEAEVFGLDAAATAELSAGTVTLESMVGCRPARATIAQAAVAAFERRFGLEADRGDMSEPERVVVARLLAEEADRSAHGRKGPPGPARGTAAAGVTLQSTSR